MTREKQDDWKRTQIRIPLAFYEEITEYSEVNNISINTAMLELMDRGIHSLDKSIVMSETESDILSRMLEGLKQIEIKQNEMVRTVEKLKELYPEDKTRLGELENALKKNNID